MEEAEAVVVEELMCLRGDLDAAGRTWDCTRTVREETSRVGQERRQSY